MPSPSCSTPSLAWRSRHAIMPFCSARCFQVALSLYLMSPAFTV
ncbi:MAG: DNA gyrase inhibitor YacG [Myxococcales bacterium]|nr:DNA gyrase inhibitor YacG [Myxococcales bacterium]